MAQQISKEQSPSPTSPTSSLEGQQSPSTSTQRSPSGGVSGQATEVTQGTASALRVSAPSTGGEGRLNFLSKRKIATTNEGTPSKRDLLTHSNEKTSSDSDSESDNSSRKKVRVQNSTSEKESSVSDNGSPAGEEELLFCDETTLSSSDGEEEKKKKKKKDDGAYQHLQKGGSQSSGNCSNLISSYPESSGGAGSGSGSGSGSVTAHISLADHEEQPPQEPSVSGGDDSKNDADLPIENVPPRDSGRKKKGTSTDSLAHEPKDWCTPGLRL